MQKRAYGAVALAGAATMLMSACGGGSTPTAPAATDAAGATASASAATTAAASPTTTAAPVRDANVDLVIWCDNDRKAILDKYATQFGQEQGIKVAVQVSTDVRKDFKDATNVGKGPDVIVGAHDWLGELVQNGAVEPVQLSTDQQAKFTKASIQAAKYNGQLYGVPYATENLGLMRNTALAPDAPATYEDMVTKGKQLVADGKATNALLQQVSKTGDAYYTYPYMKAFGGGIFGTKDNCDYDPTKVLVDSEGSVKGLSYLGQLGKDNILSTNVDFDTAQSLFATGKVPYYVTGPWAVDKAKASGIKYGISPLPTLQGNKVTPFLGVQMFYVSAKAKNDAFAQEFVTNYVTKPELQVDMFNIGHRPPALQEALDKVSATDTDVKAWSDAGQGAAPMPNIPAMNSVWGPLGQAEADVVSQKATASDRLKAAQTEIVANIQKNG
jgi:arabinogalactan oligomer / maltooligosaccharide transport system substrate-binding protein